MNPVTKNVVVGKCLPKSQKKKWESSHWLNMEFEHVTRTHSPTYNTSVHLKAPSSPNPKLPVHSLVTKKTNLSHHFCRKSTLHWPNSCFQKIYSVWMQESKWGSTWLQSQFTWETEVWGSLIGGQYTSTKKKKVTWEIRGTMPKGGMIKSGWLHDFNWMVLIITKDAQTMKKVMGECHRWTPGIRLYLLNRRLLNIWTLTYPLRENMGYRESSRLSPCRSNTDCGELCKPGKVS